MKLRPVLVAALVAGAAMILLFLRSAAPASGPAPVGVPGSTAQVTLEPGPTGSPIGGVRAEVPGATRPKLFAYAVAVTEIAGLPPDAEAGTTLDLWVSWEPPLVEPRDVGVQSLMRRVILEKIVPPVTPEGPYVATLLVDRRQVADLLNADRYGALSVTLPR
jgi:hypothetical protein